MSICQPSNTVNTILTFFQIIIAHSHLAPPQLLQLLVVAAAGVQRPAPLHFAAVACVASWQVGAAAVAAACAAWLLAGGYRLQLPQLPDAAVAVAAAHRDGAAWKARPGPALASRGGLREEIIKKRYFATTF